MATIISHKSDLTETQKRTCDDLLAVLLQRNHPINPPTLSSLRTTLWTKVFAADNWTTASPNPAPGPLRKRTSEETALYVGTLNEDVPVKKSRSNNNNNNNNNTVPVTVPVPVPAHRRARCPVQFKASFAFGGKLTFYWIDDEGQKIPAEAVDVEGGLGSDDIESMVASHYDANEMDRVGEWNWAKVVYWGRARLTAVARRTPGVGVIHRPQPVPDVHEDVDELQQIRLVEEYMKKAREAAEADGEAEEAEEDDKSS